MTDIQVVEVLVPNSPEIIEIDVPGIQGPGPRLGILVIDDDYTPDIDDQELLIRADAGADITLSADLPEGYRILVGRNTLEQVKFVAGAGASIKSEEGNYLIRDRYDIVEAIVVVNADDESAEWWLRGAMVGDSSFMLDFSDPDNSGYMALVF